MSRTVKIAIAAPEADRLVELLGQTEGVIGMSLQPGASLKPRGDVLTVDVTNEGFERLLDEIHAGGFGETSIVTSEPRSVVSSSYQQAIDGETNESSWHEMSALLHRESNVTTNYLIAMFSAGLIAGAGLWTETVHIVVGAMVIAPGFVPILRVPFGFLAGRAEVWKQGLKSLAIGYLMLLIGAAALLLAVWILVGERVPLAENHWVLYWSTVSPMAVLVALAAGAAGAAIVAAQRSVLSAGVMIALALIPSASITSMALLGGDFPLALGALGRWLTDVACVIVAGGLVLAAKRTALRLRRRRRPTPAAAAHRGTA